MSIEFLIYSTQIFLKVRESIGILTLWAYSRGVFCDKLSFKNHLSFYTTVKYLVWKTVSSCAHMDEWQRKMWTMPKMQKVRKLHTDRAYDYRTGKYSMGVNHPIPLEFLLLKILVSSREVKISHLWCTETAMFLFLGCFSFEGMKFIIYFYSCSARSSAGLQSKTDASLFSVF